jgi:putative ABC transport system substrate-binding protein
MFTQRGAGALLAGTGAFMNSKRESIVGLAASHVLPACYALREFVTAGDMISAGMVERGERKQTAAEASKAD